MASLARKFAEEYVNILKYNPELTHDERILSLELRLDKLIADVEKGCAEAHQRLVPQKSEEPMSSGHPMLYFGRNMGDEVIISETPNEREETFSKLIKSRGPAN